MRARVLLYLGMILLALGGVTACGQQDKAPEAAETTPAAKDEVALTEIADVTAQISAVHRRVRLARRDALRSNREEGSLFLNEVANLLTERAVGSSGPLKEDLQFSASEFTGISERLYSGPPITREEMDFAITRSYWALAAFHHEQAVQRWNAGNAREAGLQLSAAATLIDGAIGYVEARVDEPGKELIVKIRDLAQQLEQEDGPASDAVGQRMLEVGQEIQQLRRTARQVLSEQEAV